MYSFEELLFRFGILLAYESNCELVKKSCNIVALHSQVFFFAPSLSSFYTHFLLKSILSVVMLAVEEHHDPKHKCLNAKDVQLRGVDHLLLDWTIGHFDHQLGGFHQLSTNVLSGSLRCGWISEKIVSVLGYFFYISPEKWRRNPKNLEKSSKNT